MKRRADYEVGTLESKVEVQINDAVKSIETLIGSLGSLKSSLNSTLGASNNNNIKDDADNLAKTFNTLRKAVNFSAIYVGAKKIWNYAKGISSDYIDMVETSNLFEVSMGKVVDQYGKVDEAQSEYYNKAIKFQNDMNESLLTNRAEMEKYQAMYFSMLKSQNINKNKSYFMSENLTKAGYDIASLYNLDVSDAMNKLKSGLAGQVESLRKIGIDVSESALQNVLNEAGIDKKVQQLSYAEKEIVRYNAIMQQASQAQGDFVKTMDNSANQIKMFKNQLAELRQVAGAFIVNTFGGIITYATAVIMVVKEILKAFANLFGYDLNTSGTTGLSGISDTVGDIGTGLGNATKKAKEFKKQIMSFDEIHNIEAPTSSGGSSGSGGGSNYGIDSRLLDNLKNWDNKMEGIKSKAAEIRDRMLEWLGFKRDDKGGWKLGEGYTNFEKILDVVKTIGLAILTWKVSSAITNLFSKLGILSGAQAFQWAFGLTLSLTGIYLMYKGIKHLLDGNVDIFSILETALGGAMVTFGIASILKGTIKSISFGNALKMGFGLILALTGIFLEYNSIKTMLTGDISLGTILKATGNALLIGLGVWLLTGNVTAGLLTGAGVIALNFGIEVGVAIAKFINGSDKVTEVAEDLTEKLKNLNEEIDNNNTAYKNSIKSIENTYKAHKTEMEYAKRLTKQLDGLIDSNGKVKKGTEERVDFILGELSKALGTEIKRNGDVITQNGKVVKSYQDLQKDIEKTIKSLEKEARTQAIKEKYTESIKAQIESEKDLQKTKEELATATLKYDELMAKGYSKWTLTHDKNCKQIIQNYIDTNTAHKKALDNHAEICQDMTYYYVEMLKNTSNSTKKTNEEVTNSSKKAKEQLTSISKDTKKAFNNGLNGIDKDAKTRVQEAIDAIRSKGTSAGNASKSVANLIKEKFNLDPEKAKTSGANFIQGFINKLKSNNFNPLNVFATVTKVAANIVSWWNKGLKERSPSRATMQSAVYFVEGFTIQMGKSSKDMYNQAKNIATNITDEFSNNIGVSSAITDMNRGIKINTKDFAVDTNQYVDYGAINGQVQAQSNITISQNIIQGIAEAVGDAMRNSEVNVNIEAKTEDGVIVKKASEGFRNYVMQTGELPFPVPV